MSELRHKLLDLNPSKTLVINGGARVTRLPNHRYQIEAPGFTQVVRLLNDEETVDRVLEVLQEKGLIVEGKRSREEVLKMLDTRIWRHISQLQPVHMQTLKALQRAGLIERSGDEGELWRLKKPASERSVLPNGNPDHDIHLSMPGPDGKMHRISSETKFEGDVLPNGNHTHTLHVPVADQNGRVRHVEINEVLREQAAAKPAPCPDPCSTCIPRKVLEMLAVKDPDMAKIFELMTGLESILQKGSQKEGYAK